MSPEVHEDIVLSIYTQCNINTNIAIVQDFGSNLN